MYPVERQQIIMDAVNQKKSISVHALSQLLYICPATIRRDLEQLEQLGQLRRTHGGAVALSGLASDSLLSQRKNEQIPAKIKIAQAAASFIQSGMTIAMDGSSTCLRMLAYLHKIKPLTLITNSAAIDYQNLLETEVISTGGKLDFTTMSYFGKAARQMIENYFPELFFFSAKCLSLQNGVTDSLTESVDMKQSFIKQSKTKVLLCDSSKLEQTAIAKICDIVCLDMIITDKPPSDAYLHYFNEHHIKCLF